MQRYYLFNDNIISTSILRLQFINRSIMNANQPFSFEKFVALFMNLYCEPFAAKERLKNCCVV